jgi:hypothetical protein
MKFKLLAAVLGMILGTASARAEGQKLLTFDLGSTPGGKVVDLPSWACGNIFVKELDSREPQILTLLVNIPEKFASVPMIDLVLEQGKTRTVDLKNGTSFTFYWKVAEVGNSRHVVLVVRRHCPVGGCKQLCDCK